MTPKRNRTHTTQLAKRLRRLRLNQLADAARVLGTSPRTVEAWRQGRYETPRVAMRLLAAWRLLHWGTH